MAARPLGTTIRPFAPGDARALHDLNMEWPTAFFHMEAKDDATLSDPAETILAPGGQILLADLGSGFHFFRRTAPSQTPAAVATSTASPTDA